MGWVFYYQGGQFKVKNRGTDIPTITNLDVNKILDYTVSKYKETNTFPHILILDGTIDGGDGTGGNVGGIEEEYRPYQMRGARFQLISDIANPERIGKGIWWKSIVEGLTNFVYLNANDKFVRYFNEDENTFRIAFHTRTNAPVIPPFSGWSISYSGVTQNDMLRIDVGDTGTSMWLYDVTNGDNNPHSSDASTPAPINQWTHNRIRFKGNYGNSLVKLSSAGFNVYNITNTYQDYVKTNTFFNNFVKFFDSRLTRKITVKYNEIIDNPIQVFRFINDTENHLTGTWIINSMKINFQDETTELELQRKFETVRDPNIIEDIIEIDTEVDNDLGSEEEVEI